MRRARARVTQMEPLQSCPPVSTALQSWTRRRLLRGVAACASLLGPAGSGALGAAPPVCRIGVTPVTLEDRVGLLRRWAAYLTDALGRDVRLVPFAGYQRVLEALERSELEAAWLCGYPYILRRARLRLVAVPFWHGQPLYQGYVIVREDSPWQDLRDLRGGIFAYADPLSNSGYLVVRHGLAGMGFEPDRFFGRTFFTHAHRHVIDAVADGLADGGAVDGYVWEVLREMRGARGLRTRVIWRSDWHGFPPVVCSASVSEALRLGLQRALIGMSASEAGQRILSDLYLDAFVAGDPGWYRSIERMAGVAG